jgi:hypothetical protein
MSVIGGSNNMRCWSGRGADDGGLVISGTPQPRIRRTVTVNRVFTGSTSTKSLGQKLSMMAHCSQENDDVSIAEVQIL